MTISLAELKQLRKGDRIRVYHIYDKYQSYYDYKVTSDAKTWKLAPERVEVHLLGEAPYDVGVPDYRVVKINDPRITVAEINSWRVLTDLESITRL